MSNGTSSVATFLSYILGGLSLIGRFAAFFGTLLVVWSIAAPEPARLLGGLGLILLTIADRYWGRRHPSVTYTGQRLSFFQTFVWGNCILATAFFSAFLMIGSYWLRLPSVSQFLSDVGLGVLIPGETPESAWAGQWHQWSTGAGGATYSGPLELQVTRLGALVGTFTSHGEGISRAGRLEGVLTDQGRRIEGTWSTDNGQSGSFVLMLGPGARSFAGTYSLGDRPGDANPANTWTGQRISPR